MTGLRYDQGKNRLDLIPPEWIWALGNVLTKGAAKYAERNWEKGMAWSKVFGPLLRHAFKWLAGERYDPETGCHHMAMVAWNALALMTYDLQQIGERDLPLTSGKMLDAVNAETMEPIHGKAMPIAMRVSDQERGPVPAFPDGQPMQVGDVHDLLARPEDILAPKTVPLTVDNSRVVPLTVETDGNPRGLYVLPPEGENTITFGEVCDRDCWIDPEQDPTDEVAEAVHTGRVRAVDPTFNCGASFSIGGFAKEKVPDRKPEPVDTGAYMIDYDGDGNKIALGIPKYEEDK